MSDAFTHVISSTGLPDQQESTSQGCLRNLFGLACIADQFQCICESVTNSSLTVRHDDRGAPVSAELWMTSQWGGRSIAATVIEAFDLTGMTPDIDVNPEGVTAVFNLKRSSNYGLRDYLMKHGR